MKNLKDIISEKLIINKNIKIQKYNYHPNTFGELMDLIEKLIKERGNEANLNDIDVSKIDYMKKLFAYARSNFNGDISEWDVSNVTDMSFMFQNSKFNGDISKWDVSNVKTMKWMFNGSEFTSKNGDISDWDVSNVTNMEDMFDNSPLEKNPPKWYKE